jgi:predicted transcriptional regulator of viral defense system
MATRITRAVAELAASQHGVFTRKQAASLHLDAGAIRVLIGRGVLDEPVAPVLRVRGAPLIWHQRVAIACLAVGGVASGATAAALHRLDGFRHGGPIEVSVPRSLKRRLAGIRVRAVAALDARDVVVVDGIPTTSIARTLCDLGASVSDDAVEQALDDALRRGSSLRWITETLDRLDRPGPSGTASLRRVLALPDRQGVVNESWRERVTERLLAHPELQPMVRQHEIRTPDGTLLARTDLAVVEIRLGIEFHSDQWHFGPRRGRGDRRRDRLAAEVGWHLVYLDAADHRRPSDALASVVSVARARRALGEQLGTGEPA